jgi:uncharacterized protein (DUF433 family)
MSGAPCFTGTRVPVQMLLDHLKHGETVDDFWKVLLPFAASKPNSF